MPEINQMPPNQIKYVYDFISNIALKYKKDLDVLLDRDDVFEDKCEYDTHSLKIEMIDNFLVDLELIREEFFKGLE